MRKILVILIGFLVIFPVVFSKDNLITCDGSEKDRFGWRYSVYDPYSNKIGYIDNKGNLIIEPRFNSLHQMIFRDLGWVEIDGKYGFIDGSGELVIPARFDRTLAFSEGLAEVKIDDKNGYINQKGEVVFFIDSWGHEFSEGLAAVGLAEDKWGFVDKAGNLVIGPIAKDDFTHWEEFSEGMAAIEKEEKYGFIDKSGKMVIEPKFKYCYSFHEGLASVYFDGSYGYIDKSGRFVIEPQFDRAHHFSEGVAAVGKKVSDSGDMEYFLIDRKGEILAGPKRGWNGVGIFNGGLAGVGVNSRHGFINRKFELVIEPIFYSLGVGNFKDGGIVGARGDGLTGYIDREGRWVWSRPTGRSLTFFFRDTTHTELKKTIQAFEPVTAKEEEEYRILFPRRWEYRSKKGILLHMRIEDWALLADSVILGVDEKRLAFEAALYANAVVKAGEKAPEATAVLDININPGIEAEEALRDFAIYVLSAHPGVVGDEYHNHAWTLEEIKEDKTWNGIHFLKPHKRD